MKRILFLGFNRKYVNPYLNTILNIISSFSELDYYGPGFSSDKDLNLGIESWIKNRKYDLVLTDAAVILSSEVKSEINAKELFLFDVIYFDPKEYFNTAKKFHLFFNQYSGDKVIIGNWDSYNLKKSTVDYINKTNAFIIDFGGYRINKSSEKIKKSYPFKQFQINDNWYNFLKLNEDRIIVAPHTINSSEFENIPLKTKKYLFTIVGVKYPERNYVRKLLSWKHIYEDFHIKLKLKLNYFFKKRFTYKSLDSYRSKYFNRISDTKLVFCSGGPVFYPVRKYFEIPAKGSIPIGWECSGFSNLGFKDGYNFVIAKDSHSIKKFLKNKSDDELQKIANNAKKLVWENHSDWARKNQLKSSFELIFNKKFKGSYWEDGNYYNY